MEEVVDAVVVPADVDLTALGIYNVKDPAFGAVGDGSTDDTAAIQSAIIAAGAAGGGTVYLPRSRYLIDGGRIAKGSVPGDTMGAMCYGIGTLPAGVVWAPNGDVAHQAGYCGPNFPPTLNPGFGGTLPDERTIPNGPLLLFDNVTLLGDGPGATVLLAGEQIYDGWIFNPQGQIYPVGSSTLVPLPQLGAVVSSWNNWAAWPLTVASGSGYPVDGFAAHNCYVRGLSVDCQGHMGINAGKPLHIYVTDTFSDEPNNIGSNAIRYAEETDGTVPQGQLYGAAISLQTVQNCGVEDVNVQNGNVNGINLTGTQNLHAHANGPVPTSYQQVTGPDPVNPDGLDVYVPPISPEGTPDSNSNVPAINGFIKHCRVDLNYPEWIAGTRPESGHGNTGGSEGNLPIRAVGGAVIAISGNQVGLRNQPSDFSRFTPPLGYSNYPDVAPNTNDAMDCPGCWHIAITGNIITNCGDGVGSEGNGDMIVAHNLFYNFGSVGVDAPSNAGKSCSQTVISDNVFFLSANSGAPQMAINVDDVTPTGPLDPYASGQSSGAGDPSQQASAQQGDVTITNNIFYAPGNNIVVNLRAWGAIVEGNIFDFAGLTPYNNPVYNPHQNPGEGSFSWPAPSSTGIAVRGNDIVIEGNIFRNAAAAGTQNNNVIGISFPSGFPPYYKADDSTRVIIKGNIFDDTIKTPIKDDSSGTDGLLGVRVLDNIGINPAGQLDATLVPVPNAGVVFPNPYPYDCFVNVTAGGGQTTILLYNVSFATIASGEQKAFLVKAGGTITLEYNPLVLHPTWVWVGL